MKSVCIEMVGEDSFEVAYGANLRRVLLDQGRSPYRGVFEKLNCAGMGVCGKCEVEVLGEDGAFWPRRSCQIRCFSDTLVRLVQG